MTEGRETIGMIFAAVATEGGWTIAQMVGPTQRGDISRHRQVGMWLAHRRLGISLAAIGRALQRDHTTVRWGIARVTINITDDACLKSFADRVVDRLEGRVETTVAEVPPPELEERTELQKARDEARDRLSEPAASVFFDRRPARETRAWYAEQNERFSRAMQAALSEDAA